VSSETNTPKSDTKQLLNGSKQAALDLCALGSASFCTSTYSACAADQRGDP
jgi:hypothetical protein